LIAFGTASAQVGVGVNVGKIRVDESVSPGGSYTLPTIGVVNTGHDPSEYGLRITYQFEQEALEPPKKWFSFKPELFQLEPGKTQNVEIRLDLPLTARPGDYFALIEAYPVSSGGGGGVSIGISAATKLDFTVKPSNVFSAAFLWSYHRFVDGSPWSWIGVGIFGGAVLGFLVYKFVPLRIQVGRRD
jgi:uncharacterized membrane protein